jgi:hypothetical protein
MTVAIESRRTVSLPILHVLRIGPKIGLSKIQGHPSGVNLLGLVQDTAQLHSCRAPQARMAAGPSLARQVTVAPAVTVPLMSGGGMPVEVQLMGQDAPVT